MSRLSPQQEQDRTHKLYEQQRQCGHLAFVIGVDEVGRGPLAGPLSVAAVALPLQPQILGLNDSKKLSAKKRCELDLQIRAAALCVSITGTEACEIDTHGITECLRVSMIKAIHNCERKLGRSADLVLIDGLPMQIHPKERCFVKGDSIHAPIAAASIVAKVARDKMMVEYDSVYPGYDFASNKGYGTAKHIQAIKDLGICAIHRRSFCRNFLV